MSDRTTIVFGGSSGIGQAIAERCAQDGDHIVLVARSAEKLAAAAASVRSAGAASVRTMTTDLSDAARVRETVAALEREVPVPGRIVLNGGGPPFGPFTQLSMEQWRTAIDLVLLGHVQVLQSIVPRLRTGSAVVAVLSDAVRQSGPDKVLPSSLRLAMLGLIKCLALEFANQGVRFNAVSPGPTSTERAVQLVARAAAANGITAEEQHERAVGSLPMRRFASPQEVAAVAHFLLSDAAAYVTGANYLCDGGLTTVPL